MMGPVRSELIRLLRRSTILGWLGLTALFALLINVFIFESVKGGHALPATGPGTAFPTRAQLVGPGGLTAGLGAVATLLGVVTLSFWAIAVATDYSSGFIRLTVQAQPDRFRLLAGKVAALVVWTAGATSIALAVNVGVAPALARVGGISTATWRHAAAAHIAGAWVNTFLVLVIWGVIGLAIAYVTRSAAVAIGAGVAYVLVFETFIQQVAKSAGHWLPGSTLSALASGGNAHVGYHAALLLGIGYMLVGLVLSWVVFARRDITE
jgi:ABC-type transport system involved in multi-copper enzyme maturation permease subunit